MIIITFQLQINGYSLIISRRFFMINNNQIDKIKMRKI
ncbi:adenine deaminase [Escherichia albertii KF1]|nr:adenine deaminase [Escherichia albertii KF1]